MQPTITIKSIAQQHVLDDEKYKYVLKHLNEPHKIASVWYCRNGKIDHIAFYENGSEGIITIFANNHVKGEFNYGTKFQLS